MCSYYSEYQLQGLLQNEKKEFKQELENNKNALTKANVTHQNTGMVLAISRLLLGAFLVAKANKGFYMTVATAGAPRKGMAILDIMQYSVDAVIILLPKAAQYDKSSVEAIKSELRELEETTLAEQIKSTLPLLSLTSAPISAGDINTKPNTDTGGGEENDKIGEKNQQKEGRRSSATLRCNSFLPLRGK